METSILLERKRTMYQDSAQINQQGHDILNTVIAHERNNSNTISKRSTYILCTVSTIFLAISFVCIFYFRKKHLQHKAEKKEWEETLQAEIAKANLRRKQELAEKERENATLQEKVSQLVVKKPTHRQEEYKTSALYIKVSRITKDLQKVETKENLNEEEWSQFTALTNAGWYGIITYLDERYNLSAEEIREYRGTLKEPGKESPYRNRSVEENLELFEKMKNGELQMERKYFEQRLIC